MDVGRALRAWYLCPRSRCSVTVSGQDEDASEARAQREEGLRSRGHSARRRGATLEAVILDRVNVFLDVGPKVLGRTEAQRQRAVLTIARSVRDI